MLGHIYAIRTKKIKVKFYMECDEIENVLFLGSYLKCTLS